eukprot:2207689-Alexandrium_andersonii.AAC.1
MDGRNNPRGLGGASFVTRIRLVLTLCNRPTSVGPSRCLRTRSDTLRDLASLFGRPRGDNNSGRTPLEAL